MTPAENKVLIDELEKNYTEINDAHYWIAHFATQVTVVAKKLIKARDRRREIISRSDLTNYVPPAINDEPAHIPIQGMINHLRAASLLTDDADLGVTKPNPAPDAANGKVWEKPKTGGMRSFWVGEEAESKKYALGPLEKAMKEWREGTLRSVRGKKHIPNIHDILLWTAMSDYFGYKEDDAPGGSRIESIVANVFGVLADRIHGDQAKSQKGYSATEESIKQQSEATSIKDILKKMVPDGSVNVTWNEGFEKFAEGISSGTKGPDYKKLVHAVQKWFDQQSAAKRRGTLPMSWDIELAKVVTEVFNLSVESESPTENGEPAAPRPKEIPEDEIFDDPRPDDIRPQASDIVYSAFAENAGFMMGLPKSDRTYMTFEIRRHEDGAISFETMIEPTS